MKRYDRLDVLSIDRCDVLGDPLDIARVIDRLSGEVAFERKSGSEFYLIKLHLVGLRKLVSDDVLVNQRVVSSQQMYDLDEPVEEDR